MKRLTMGLAVFVIAVAAFMLLNPPQMAAQSCTQYAGCTAQTVNYPYIYVNAPCEPSGPGGACACPLENQSGLNMRTNSCPY